MSWPDDIRRREVLAGLAAAGAAVLGASALPASALARRDATTPLNLVFEGDSITANTYNGGNWVATFLQLLRASGATVTSTITALPGSTMDGAGGSPSVAARAAADDTHLAAGAENWIVLLCGVNDNAQGTPLATLQANTLAWTTARRANGWNVAWITHPGNWNTSTGEANRTQFNSWLRSQSVPVIEFATNPDIGIQANYHEPWSYDRVHPDAPGALVMGQCAEVSWRALKGLPARTTITSFSPIRTLAGATITFSGQGFTGASAVSFNGVAASTFAVVNDTRLTAVLPVTTTGANVKVTSPAGTDTSLLTFSYAPPTMPVITGFSPQTGFTKDKITFTGTGLATVTSVRFSGPDGTQVPTAVYGVGNTTFSCLVPAGLGNTVGAITSYGSDGSVATTPANFTPNPAPPTIRYCQPDNGTSTNAFWPGMSLQIFGTGLSTPPVSISGNGTKWPVGNVVSSKNISVMVPAGATSGNLVITTANGASNSFPYTIIRQPAPVITSFTPTTVARGAVLTVQGIALHGLTATGITVGGVALGAANFLDCIDSRVRFKIPATVSVWPHSFTLTTAFGSVTGRTIYVT